jgi:hypothetical protein
MSEHSCGLRGSNDRWKDDGGVARAQYQIRAARLEVLRVTQ